jgi:hypothetical protein
MMIIESFMLTNDNINNIINNINNEKEKEKEKEKTNCFMKPLVKPLMSFGGLQLKSKQPPKKDEDTPKENKKIQSEKNLFYIPKQKDTLFWCFYLIKYGHDVYDSLFLMGMDIIKEKKIKIDFIEDLRTEKKNIKKYKLGTLSDIESNLVNDDIIDLTTFFALCFLEKKNVLYVSEKTYYEFLTKDEDEDEDKDEDENIDANVKNTNTIIIKKFEKKYGYTCSITQQEITNYKEKLFKLNFCDNKNKDKKILKSISSYKSSDLIEICNKLCLTTKNDKGKQLLKKTMYELIIQTLS